jgi:hypothetical protein
MKYFYSWVVLTMFACGQQNEHDQHQSHQSSNSEVLQDTAKGSPHRTVMANIGELHVHMEYNSPAVRKRIIWGGLVPFDEVWVSGAHMATSISFSGDVWINGQKVEQGKYAFFSIPSQGEWTLILNKNWEQHLTDEYSQADDVLRWKVKPEPAEHNERLNYSLIPQGPKLIVAMQWETIKIAFEVHSKPVNEAILG